MRQDFHIILIHLLLVPELAHPLVEEVVVEKTPAQKNFNTRTPKTADYMKKRSTEKTTTSKTSECPLDMKVLQALNQVVQEPQVVVENLKDIVAEKPAKGKGTTPIIIQPTGTGNFCLACLSTPKSRLNRMTQNCLCLFSDPNLKDVNEDVATVVGSVMQKHGVSFKHNQHEKDKQEMEKKRIITKNRGRIEQQMVDLV